MFYEYLTHGYFALSALYFPFYGNKIILFYDFLHLWSTHKYELDPGRCWASGPDPEKHFSASLNMKLILGFNWQLSQLLGRKDKALENKISICSCKYCLQFIAELVEAWMFPQAGRPLFCLNDHMFFLQQWNPGLITSCDLINVVMYNNKWCESRCFLKYWGNMPDYSDCMVTNTPEVMMVLLSCRSDHSSYPSAKLWQLHSHFHIARNPCRQLCLC